jgi:transposase
VGIVAVGIDLAKNVFALHGVDETGKVVLRRPSVKRDQLLAFFASQPPCLVGMEACGGAHEWARKLNALGPRFDTISKVCAALGVKLVAQPIHA